MVVILSSVGFCTLGCILIVTQGAMICKAQYMGALGDAAVSVKKRQILAFFEKNKKYFHKSLDKRALLWYDIRAVWLMRV